MHPLNLIIQPLLGCAAGYITNEYAINMLFKSYTPLKLGGVIPKTREKFIENIINLINNDIISKEKLSKILDDDDYLKKIDDFVNTFFTKNLYEASKNIAIKDIPSAKESEQKFFNFVSSQIKAEIPKLTDFIIKNINPSEMLDNTSVDMISESIFNIFYENLSKTDLLPKILNDTINSNSSKDLTLKDVIGENTICTISNNLINALLNDETMPTSFETKLSNTINEIFLHTDLYSPIYYTFLNYSVQNREYLNSTLNTIFINISKSQEFDEFTNELSKYLFEYANNLDAPLSELLDDSFWNSINKIIDDILPCIVESFSSIAIESDDDVIKLLKESVDEALAIQDSSKKAILNLAKPFINNMLSTDNFDNLILGIKQNEELSAKLKLMILSKIHALLDNMTLSQLAKLLTDKKMISQKDLAALMKIMLEKNTNTLATLLSDRLPQLFRTKEITEIIRLKTAETLKNKLIHSKILKEILKDSIDDYIIKISDIKLNQFFVENANKNGNTNKNDSTNKSEINNYLLEFIIKNKEPITKKIKKSIYASANGFLDVLSNEKTEAYINPLIEKTEAKLLDMSLSDILDKINSVDAIHKYSTAMTVKTLKNNMLDYFQSYLTQSIHDNLNKLDDDELCEMAKIFIGNNLKPIMTFGGILGGAAGLAMALLYPNNSFNIAFSLPGAISYAAVGILTNAIAINMLFRPYTENKFLRRLPILKNFSIGYIPKNKAVLADTMAYAIDEYLIKDDYVNKLIEKNSDNIKNKIFNSIASDNYSKLGTFIINNKNSIITQCDRAIKSSIPKISEIGTDKLINIIKNIDIDLKNHQKNINDIISSKLNELATSNIKLDGFTNNKLIKSYSDTLWKNAYTFSDTMLDEINYENFVNLISKYENLFEQAMEIKINQLITDNTVKSAIPAVKVVIKNKYIRNEIVQIINKLTTSDINLYVLDKKAGNFSNKLLDKLSENMKMMIMNFSKKSLPTISDALWEKINQSLGFFARNAFSMIGGKAFVNSIVEIFILKKLPILIDSKKDEIIEKLRNIINEKILLISLKDLGFALKNEFLDNKMFIEANTKVYGNNKNSICTPDEMFLKFSDALKTALGDLKFKDITKNTNISNFDEILNNYSHEINCIIEQLRIFLKNDKDRWFTDFRTLIEEKIEISTKDLSLKDLLDDFSDSEISSLSNVLSEMIVNSSSVKSFANEVISNINPDYVHNLIEASLNNLLSDASFNANLRNSQEAIFDAIACDNFKIVDRKLLDYLNNIVADAGILTLKSETKGLIHDIKLSEIAKNQINSMNPEKIHKMFDSFAGKYFNTLILYGLFGSIFGINNIIGAILSIAYIINKKKNL